MSTRSGWQIPPSTPQFAGAAAATALAAATAAFLIALLGARVIPTGIPPIRAVGAAGLGVIGMAISMWLLCACGSCGVLPMPVRFTRWITTLLLIRITIDQALHGRTGLSSALAACLVGTFSITLLTRSARQTIGAGQ